MPCRRANGNPLGIGHMKVRGPFGVGHDRSDRSRPEGIHGAVPALRRLHEHRVIVRVCEEKLVQTQNVFGLVFSEPGPTLIKSRQAVSISRPTSPQRTLQEARESVAIIFETRRNSQIF